MRIGLTKGVLEVERGALVGRRIVLSSRDPLVEIPYPGPIVVRERIVGAIRGWGDLEPSEELTGGILGLGEQATGFIELSVEIAEGYQAGKGLAPEGLDAASERIGQGSQAGLADRPDQRGSISHGVILADRGRGRGTGPAAQGSGATKAGHEPAFVFVRVFPNRCSALV